MLGAFKVWALGQKNPKSPRGSRRNSLNVPSICVTSPLSKQSSVDGNIEENATKMGEYGHLLHCPLCHELFTHPVLLPCQHSLCYGCARAQILSGDVIDDIMEISSPTTSRQNSDSDMLSYVTSPSYSPGFGKVPGLNFADVSTSSVSNDSGFKVDDSESSFVLSTNDCLHFEPDDSFKSESPRSLSFKRVFSPSRSSMTSLAATLSSATSLHPPPKSAKLRRSSSTSSIARTAMTTRRSQQNYGSLKRSRVKSLFCPTCEKRVELGKLGISGLFRNFALESIVERFRTAAKAAVAIRCGYCKPPAADATKSCLDCKLSYCNECFKIVHIWGTKKAQHTYVGPTNNFTRPKVLLCPEHSNEVSLYCNKCKKSVCRMCKLGGGAHVNHSVTSAKSAYREAKERLCADLAVLKVKKEAMETKIDSLGEAFTALERRDAETREQIHSSLDGMYRILEVKRNELLAKADAQMREKEHELRQEMQRHHSCMMSASIASFAEEVLKETDPNFFLQTSRMVEMRLKEAIENLSDTGNSDAELQPAALDLDLTSVKEQMQNIDFVCKVDAPDMGVNGDDAASTSSMSGETFHWVCADNRDDVIRTEDEGRKIYVGRSTFKPCLLKGSVSFSSGSHYWEVMVTSHGSSRVKVGVGNINTDERLHGSAESYTGGAFLDIRPGYVIMSEGNRFGNKLTSFEASEGQSLHDAAQKLSIGDHVFTVGIRLQISVDEASVCFYDVTSEVSRERRDLFEAQFKFQPPVYPIVVVDGKASVAVM